MLLYLFLRQKAPWIYDKCVVSKIVLSSDDLLMLLLSIGAEYHDDPFESEFWAGGFIHQNTACLYKHTHAPFGHGP